MIDLNLENKMPVHVGDRHYYFYDLNKSDIENLLYMYDNSMTKNYMYGRKVFSFSADYLKFDIDGYKLIVSQAA